MGGSRKPPYFFKSSTDIYSKSICFARSISAASARMQMDMRGRGTLGNLQGDHCGLVGNIARQSSNALDGSRETLVSLWVVVLETNL